MSLKKIFPFLVWLPLVKNSWKDDLLAGLTGTIIMIPQAVAFAMIAGLPPIYGFYTAMITPIIAALFGSSYHLMTGPTTTSSIVIYAVISKFANPETDLEAFISLAILVSFMAGVFKLVMGLIKMGKLVNFVSHSVVIGFAAGAGVLIAFKQVKYVLGIDIPQGSSFLEIIIYSIQHILETNVYVLGVALFTLLAAALFKNIRFFSKLYMILALLLGTILTLILQGSLHGIETVGHVPSNLPPFKIPDFDFNTMGSLTAGAATIALLGLVEAVSISRVIAMKTNQKLDSNQEFIGQGLANVISSFFSSYTSSGSFSRSAINYQIGAKTPLSAIISGLGLMLVVLFFAQYASFLPKPVMGGIIVLVGYNLIDFQQIKRIVKSSKKEFIVLFVTIIGTLFLTLELALFAGILFSLFFYLEKTSKPNIAVLGKSEGGLMLNVIRDTATKECSQIKVIRIDGSIYFGAVEGISNYFSELYEIQEPKHLLIMANGINFIDLAGAEWLTKEVKKWQSRGGGIYFVGLKIISQDVLKNGGFIEEIGAEHFFKEMDIATKTICKKLDISICESCKACIFNEF
ncbi:MAG: sulfate permease [Lutibacter sp.]|nr:sulfate permease [Lutibacter sp.]